MYENNLLWVTRQGRLTVITVTIQSKQNNKILSVINQSIKLRVSVYLSLCLSLCLLSAFLSLVQSAVCLSAFCLSVCLFVCCLLFSISRSVCCLSVCLPDWDNLSFFPRQTSITRIVWMGPNITSVSKEKSTTVTLRNWKLKFSSFSCFLKTKTTSPHHNFMWKN